MFHAMIPEFTTCESLFFVLMPIVMLPFFFIYAGGSGVAIGAALLFADFLIAWQLWKRDVALQRNAGVECSEPRYFT